MLRRLLLRKGVSEDGLEAMIASVEECGSAYLPEVNAFYVREFQMMHAAEDATRFLHQACQGLPQRLNGHARESDRDDDERAADRFYARVVEHAVAYFGSRVLYPSRPAAAAENALLSRGASKKLRTPQFGADERSSTPLRATLGRGSAARSMMLISRAKSRPSGLRRLFLAHLHEPGIARKVCGAVDRKLRAAPAPRQKQPLLKR